MNSNSRRGVRVVTVLGRGLDPAPKSILVCPKLPEFGHSSQLQKPFVHREMPKLERFSELRHFLKGSELGCGLYG